MRIIRLRVSGVLGRWGLRNVQLGVLVGTVSLEVLSDNNGLLDEVVEVLWDGWAETWS